MIHGIGTDILSMERLKPLMNTLDDPFFRVYTAAEREEAAASPDPLCYYAGRFAAKEAVFKALSLSGDRVRLSDIETLRGAYGQPVVTLHGDLKTHAAAQSITAIHLSLSNDPPYVIAYAVCEKAG